VPIHSQIWGKVAWVGYGDHLDVIGHFHDDASARKQEVASGVPPHVDWLRSGSDFDRARFASLVDAVAAGLLSSVRQT
jgi:triacylglycerol lipase